MKSSKYRIVEHITSYDVQRFIGDVDHKDLYWGISINSEWETIKTVYTYKKAIKFINGLLKRGMVL